MSAAIFVRLDKEPYCQIIISDTNLSLKETAKSWTWKIFVSFHIDKQSKETSCEYDQILQDHETEPKVKPAILRERCKQSFLN